MDEVHSQGACRGSGPEVENAAEPGTEGLEPGSQTGVSEGRKGGSVEGCGSGWMGLDVGTLRVEERPKRTSGGRLKEVAGCRGRRQDRS